MLSVLTHRVLHEQAHLLAGGLPTGRGRQCQYAAPEDVIPAPGSIYETKGGDVEPCS